MGSEIQKKEDQSTAVAYHREGFNDKPVEIFRDSHMFEAYISQVRVGDCFHTLERPSLWFQCTVPILKSYSSWDRERANPTFNIGACEVLQAAPVIDTWPKLDGPTIGQRTALEGLRRANVSISLVDQEGPKDDVIDMDMKLIGRD